MVKPPITLPAKYVLPPVLAPGGLDLTDPHAICEWATTLVYHDTFTRSEVLAAVTCKRWGCRWCGRQLTRRFMAIVCAAQPNRMATLTVDPKLYTNPRDAWEATSQKVSRLAAQARRKVSEWEYARSLETTKKGWPHYHLILRSPFVPHAWLKAAWQNLTGASIVDIRKIHNPEEAARYVAKYVCKQTKIDWTNRLITFSKGFKKQWTKPQVKKGRYRDLRRSQMHPAEWLHTHRHATAGPQISPTRWKLLHI